MQMISSAAGTRLAKARAATIERDQTCEELVRAVIKGEVSVAVMQARAQAKRHAAWEEYRQAADAVADELIEQGFHEMEGE